MRYARLTPDATWAAGLVAGLPAKWERRLLSRWERLRTPRAKTLRAEQEARFNANTFIRRTTAALERVRVPLDASDSTICDSAERMALRCAELATLFHEPCALRAAMERMCQAHGVQPPGERVEFGPAVARMTEAGWWRRKLREHHGQTLEGAALALGYVHKNAEIYCSNEAVYLDQQREVRSAAMMEATEARNELGEVFTLAELAAKSTANKAIRRAELMTRIAGFERIAGAYDHQGIFVTLTCPSRMHQWRTVGERKTEPNPRYDGYSTPKTSQAYLANVWKLIRACLHREGIFQYGFRVAEPNHDGTPHWHLLVFVEREHIERFQAIFWEYALRDSPDEPGAKKHRIKVELMHPEKGTASGYIAKYIAKNIDGYHVGYDLYGNPAIEVSQRVQAWARTWRIRQFQQVGGPAVGPWRELRRVEVLPDGAPDHLVKAHNAVNKVAVIEGRGHASVAWDHYCEAQGGVFCGRDYRIKLDMQPQEGLNRYGEEKPKRPVGVCTAGVEYVTPEWMRHMPGAVGCMERHVWWEVASKRHQWEIVGRKSKKGADTDGAVYAGNAFDSRGCLDSGSAGGFGVVGSSDVLSAHRAPWTCVNNCTEGGKSGSNAEGGSGGKGLGGGAGPRQGHGRGVYPASVGSAAGAGWVELPYGGWREGDAGWLQGSELLQWKKQHLHGPWLSDGAVRGPVFRIGGQFVQNGRVIGTAGGGVAVPGGLSHAGQVPSA
jgi:hypothetical protein